MPGETNQLELNTQTALDFVERELNLVAPLEMYLVRDVLKGWLRRSKQTATVQLGERPSPTPNGPERSDVLSPWQALTLIDKMLDQPQFGGHREALTSIQATLLVVATQQTPPTAKEDAVLAVVQAAKQEMEKTIDMAVARLAPQPGLPLSSDELIRHLCQQAYSTAKSKGWYEGTAPTVLERLALIHSEVSEAVEAYRVAPKSDRMHRSQNHAAYGVDMSNIYAADDGTLSNAWKPEGVFAELADVLIRIFDFAGSYDDGGALAEALVKKMVYNLQRPHRHGGKNA